MSALLSPHNSNNAIPVNTSALSLHHNAVVECLPTAKRPKFQGKHLITYSQRNAYSQCTAYPKYTSSVFVITNITSEIFGVQNIWCTNIQALQETSPIATPAVRGSLGAALHGGRQMYVSRSKHSAMHSGVAHLPLNLDLAPRLRLLSMSAPRLLLHAFIVAYNGQRGSYCLQSPLIRVSWHQGFTPATQTRPLQVSFGNKAMPTNITHLLLPRHQGYCLSCIRFWLQGSLLSVK